MADIRQGDNADTRSSAARRSPRKPAHSGAAVEGIDLNRILVGDCRELLASLPESVFQTCVTSPPYFGLRDYGNAKQIGMEETVEEYVAALVRAMRSVRRVLRDDGTLWLNLGDSYANDAKWGGASTHQGLSRRAHAPRMKRETGLPPKCLAGAPWRVALALVADGWTLRADIIWAKPNPLPESVSDRPSKAHEYVFLLAKSERYFYDAAAIQERATGNKPGNKPGNKYDNALAAGDERHRTKANLSKIQAVETRNARSVWSIGSEPYSGAHFATMPSALAARCIMAGSRAGDAVLDPFLGSGTVAAAAESLGRSWIGCELNPEYAELARARTAQTGLPMSEVARG